MTRFSITGTRPNGMRATLTWEDGKLGGDRTLVGWLTDYAAALDGTLQGQPGGPYTLHDHLSSPYTARALMRSLFRRGTIRQRGETPPLAIPAGAIH